MPEVLEAVAAEEVVRSFAMAEWWEDDSRERYWCEITDRPDIGADLKCPQTNGPGQPYWSYGLINEVLPGDIVFHYSKRAQCIVGASVAGGPQISERIRPSSRPVAGCLVRAAPQRFSP